MAFFEHQRTAIERFLWLAIDGSTAAVRCSSQTDKIFTKFVAKKGPKKKAEKLLIKKILGAMGGPYIHTLGELIFTAVSRCTLRLITAS
jgi:hypothetical protein